MLEHDFDLTECRILGDVASRLAAYEGSGLSPERAQELGKAEAEGRLRVLPKKGDELKHTYKAREEDEELRERLNEAGVCDHDIEIALKHIREMEGDGGENHVMGDISRR